MHTFTQKQNQPQKPVSSSLSRPNTATPKLNQSTNLTLRLQPDTERREAESAGRASLRFGHDFARLSVLPAAAGVIQTRLVVNTPGDEYEREADRVSEQVMRTPEPQLQRACACGGGCHKCQGEQTGQERERLQTKRVTPGDLGQTAVPSTVHEVLASPGQSLDSAARAFMEPRFGHDFSRVRVHSDAKAAESAQAVGALAYTVGRHVVFGNGAYQPAAPGGRRLLAHELAHVVQQHATPEPGVLRRQESDLGPGDEDQRPASPSSRPRPQPEPRPRPASCGEDLCRPGPDCRACCDFYCSGPQHEDCMQNCSPYR